MSGLPPGGGTVLVTRPEPGCTATVRRLAERGIAALAAPLLRIEPGQKLHPAGVPQAVLVTSANALGCLDPLPGIKLFAVGDATAERAAALGWATCRSAGGDAADLLALCGAELRPDGGELLLLAGEGQGRALAGGLRASGFAVSVTRAYAQRPVGTFPPDAARALAGGRVSAALFFSASAARCFAHLLPRAVHAPLRAVAALAISEAAAQPLRGLAWSAVRVAARPNSADLLALL